MPQKSNTVLELADIQTLDEDQAYGAVDGGDAAEELNEAETVFDASLEKLAEELPEVAENLEDIRGAAREIIHEFDVKPELFVNQANVMLFCAIARRSAELERNKQRIARHKYAAEREFIADATILLAGPRSGKYAEVKELIGGDNDIRTPSELASTYERFTNQQVTADLQRAIDAGLLDDVRASLHIEKGEENPYIVRVLDVANEDVFNGMKPSLTGYPSTQEVAEWEEDVRLYEQYRAGLKARTAEFLKLTGMPHMPNAFASVLLDGRRYICVTLPTAEKLLYTDQPRNKHYTESDRARELAKLEHEFTHTQGTSLMPDRNESIGLVFEERRADLLAGDRGGYAEVRSFVDIDLYLITGIHFDREIKAAKNGGDSAKFWVDFASRLGLDRALESALFVPEAYTRNGARPIQRSVSEYIGGYDSILERIYNNLSEDERAEVDVRVRKAAMAILKLPDQGQSWINARRIFQGQVFISNLLEQEIKRLRETP